MPHCCTQEVLLQAGEYKEKLMVTLVKQRVDVLINSTVHQCCLQLFYCLSGKCNVQSFKGAVAPFPCKRTAAAVTFPETRPESNCCVVTVNCNLYGICSPAHLATG